MIPRDPTDERLRERTAASFIASLIVHALAALLFFSIVQSSSQQASSESLEGSSSLVVSHVQVKRQVKTAAPVAVHPPKANVARTGPPKAPPVAAGHPPQPRHHILARETHTGPPNPTPLPPAKVLPNPQPSPAPIAMPSAAPIPQLPERAPAVSAIALKQTLTTPKPAAAPATPLPSALPSAQPRATVKPAATPAPTPAPAATVAPTALPKTPQATTAPSTPKPSAAPGAASPAPKPAASPAAQRGTAPTPGPKSLSPAGTVPVKTKPAPARPIELPPTPTPAPPPPRPKPTPVKTAAPKPAQAMNDLRSRLLAGLPHAPVAPSQAHYNGTGSIARPGDPTPPPDVLARTKFIYESRAAQRVTMYVTEVHRHGALSTCTGWIVRYPQGSAPAFGTLDSKGHLITDYPGRGGENTSKPVVESNVTFECQSALLRPYGTPPAPSPGP